MIELWMKYRASAHLLLQRMNALEKNSPEYRQLDNMYKSTIVTAKEVRRYCGSMGNSVEVKATVHPLKGPEKEVQFIARLKDETRPVRDRRPQETGPWSGTGSYSVDPETADILKTLLL